MVADFKNDLKGHTVNGRHIVFIVKKALTFPTWVWQAYWVMLQVKSIQRFKCSGVAILEPYFLEIPVQETNKKGNLARKENKVKKALVSVIVPTSALRSEVLWPLKVISSHYSLRSSRIERTF